MDSKITFRNGCRLYTTKKDGMFWGITPYDEDWCCEANSTWSIKVKEWIQFWDSHEGIKE